LPHTEPATPAGPIRNHHKGRRLRKLNELVSCAISVAAPLAWPIVSLESTTKTFIGMNVEVMRC
jgi:hypothetical protein